MTKLTQNTGQRTRGRDITLAAQHFTDRLTTDPQAAKTELADYARALKGYGLGNNIDYLAFRESFFEQDAELAWAMDSAGVKIYDHKGQGQRAWSPHIEGTDGSEAVHGSLTEGDGYINSLYGDDTLWGTSRNEHLINEDGNSLLYGAEGNDVLMAGAGDDPISSDRYPSKAISCNLAIGCGNATNDNAWRNAA